MKRRFLAIEAPATTANCPSKGARRPSQDNAAENRTGIPGDASFVFAPKGSPTTLNLAVPVATNHDVASSGVPHRTTPSTVSPDLTSEETSRIAPRARAEGSARKSLTSATSSSVVGPHPSLFFAETLTNKGVATINLRSQPTLLQQLQP